MDNENKDFNIDEQPVDNKKFVDASVLDEDIEVPEVNEEKEEVPKLRLEPDYADFDVERADIPVHPLYTHTTSYSNAATGNAYAEPTATTKPVDVPPVYTGTVDNSGVHTYNSNTVYNTPKATPAQPGNDLALGSMIVGIVGLLISFLPGIGFIGGIMGVVGIVLSVSAKGKGFKGGIAIAGLVTSIIAIAIVALKIVSCMACLSSTGYGM